MIKYFLPVLMISLLSIGCFGPFKKQPEPDPIPEPTKIMAPTVSIKWDKINPILSNKNQIISLIGLPDFIDRHNAGEDWYYYYDRSIDYAIISFPVSGYLLENVQYVLYPEWK